MRIFFSKNAEKDLEEIQIYLDLNYGAKVRDKFVLKIRHALELLMQHPKLGSKEHETKDLYGLLIHRHSKMFYRIKNDKITILAFFDTRQNPKTIPK